MRVGVYFDEYRPEDGGAFTMQGDLLQALCAQAGQSRHEFLIISNHSEAIKAVAENAGLDWMRYRRPGWIEKTAELLARMLPSLRSRLRRRSSFEKKLRGLGVDFVWFVGPRPLDLDLPYLAVVLDLQHRKQPWFPEVSEYSEWETRERRLATFLRRAAAVVVGTHVGKNEVAHFFQVPEDRIHVLPHPTPAQALKAGTRKLALDASLDIPPGYLFYPAQFWAHKNHVNLLLALKQLRDKGLVIPLVLVGSNFGNLPHVQSTIMELGLLDQVKVLGFVDSQTLISLYQNALALTYLSFFGPENLPPLEAFALGCPVIAARVDGAEEQLGGAALLVDPTSPTEIAAAIRKVHRDKKRRAYLVAKGTKRAKRWTAIDFVRGVFDILDQFEPIRRTWKK
ncbi:MAG: glycosyltransferase family 1 protein [Anaerolineales bacterium]